MEVAPNANIMVNISESSSVDHLEIKSVVEKEADINMGLNEEKAAQTESKSSVDYKKAVNKKRIAIIDSDSEDEIVLKSNETEFLNDNESITTDQKHSSKILDDGSDEEQRGNDQVFQNVDQSLSLNRNHSRKLLDSDSEEENAVINHANSKQESNIESNIKNKPKYTLLDSESEEDEPKKSSPVSKKNRINSDNSEDEDTVTPHNKSFNEDLQQSTATLAAVIYTTNEKGELLPENSNIPQKHRLNNICDSESSEDETATNYHETHEGNESDQENLVKPIQYRGPKKSKGQESKPKKMTSKDAAKLRHEIKSESMRMLRESNISLPYHKPKAYTLKEFLEKRKRFASALPVDPKIPPAVAIKMSKEQLKLVSKKFKEREKEMKEFFKSESESEEEDNTGQEYQEGSKDQKDSGAKEQEKKQENAETTAESSGVTKTVEGTEQLNEDYEENNIETLRMDSSDDISDLNLDFATNNDSEVADEKVTSSKNSQDNAENQVLDVNSLQQSADDKDSVESREENMETTETLASTDGIFSSNQNDDIKEYLLNTEKHENSNDHQKESDLKQYQNLVDATNYKQLDPSNNSDAVKPQKVIILDDQLIKPNAVLAQTDFNLLKENEGHNFKENLKTLDKTEPLRNDQETGLADNQNESQSESMEYEFNLDDLDDEKHDSKEHGTKIQTDHLQANDIQDQHSHSPNGNLLVKSRYCLAEVDQNDSLQVTEVVSRESKQKKLNRLELLKEQLANTQPRLSGGPNDVIDLDEGVARPSEVSKLMERFIKHTAKRNIPKHKVHLSVVNVIGGEVHKETVDMTVDEDEPLAIEEKPGAKLKKLKAELQLQMAQKRSEQWMKKKCQSSLVADKEDNSDETTDCTPEDDILDDEEEAELTDASLEEEEEEEIDEDEYAKSDKPKKTSQFVEEEAEESELDDEGEDTGKNDDEENPENEVEDDASDFDNDDCEEMEMDLHKKTNETDNVSENNQNIDETSPKNRTLKRIIRPFTDDSDDESSNDSVESTKAVCQNASETVVNRKENENSQGSTEDEDMLPPHQNPPLKTPQRQTQQKSDLGFFLTPVSYMTGLQSLNSGSKFLRNSPQISPFPMQNEPSPLRDADWQSGLQKKLFSDGDHVSDSQSSDDHTSQRGSSKGVRQLFNDEPNTQEILEICSGVFTDETSDSVQRLQNRGNSCDIEHKEIAETQPSTQDLLAVCSGQFTGITQNENVVEFGNMVTENDCQDQPSTQELLDVCSGAFTGVTQNESTNDLKENESEKDIEIDAKKEQSSTLLRNPDNGLVTHIVLDTENKEVKSLDEDQDLIISQLLDEEELEQFKKKFDSPEKKKSSKRMLILDGDEVAGSGAVIDSDDENEGLEIKKKKKQRKLVFSDDEDEEDLPENEEEENNEDEEDIDLNEENELIEDEGDVAYDSEENEIDMDKEERKQVLKPSDFFEKEAELSESDWDSADEDEKDLDDMEFEEADKEKFDEQQVRSDLEKIHMRRMLDDDTREVKILQELLLEDGELHGTGRQRQFRWKNIDSTTFDDTEKKDDDQDVFLEEDESEEHCRKMRHQREMFLKEKQNSQQLDEDDDLLSDSQILTFGQKAKIKCLSANNSQNSTPIEKNKNTPSSPEVKQPFSLVHKRGSFLSRSEQVLKRLEEITKVTSITNGAMKNSRNFVFQTVTETNVTVIENKKRKAEEGTPNILKKIRISSLTPSDKKKTDKSDRAKKLFNYL